jgi:hypothetical protein
LGTRFNVTKLSYRDCGLNRGEGGFGDPLQLNKIILSRLRIEPRRRRLGIRFNLTRLSSGESGFGTRFNLTRLSSGESGFGTRFNLTKLSYRDCGLNCGEGGLGPAST